MTFDAMVIGDTADAIAAAAMLRRAGIATETVWRGKLKKLLARAASAEIVVIATGGPIIVRDMILHEQRSTERAGLAATLADAFDGYLIDQRPRDRAPEPTWQASALSRFLYTDFCTSLYAVEAALA